MTPQRTVSARNMRTPIDLRGAIGHGSGESRSTYEIAEKWRVAGPEPEAARTFDPEALGTGAVGRSSSPRLPQPEFPPGSQDGLLHTHSAKISPSATRAASATWVNQRVGRVRRFTAFFWPGVLSNRNGYLEFL